MTWVQSLEQYGRRELIPAGCSVTSTCELWLTHVPAPKSFMPTQSVLSYMSFPLSNDCIVFNMKESNGMKKNIRRSQLILPTSIPDCVFRSCSERHKQWEQVWSCRHRGKPARHGLRPPGAREPGAEPECHCLSSHSGSFHRCGIQVLLGCFLNIVVIRI